MMVEPQDACMSDVAEVNITGFSFSNSSGSRLAKAECQETTESSSSFDDTFSGTENVDNLSDSEVVSGSCRDRSSALRINGSDGDFRKRKLTLHWRSTVRPFAWRCKYLELQLKKLYAQAKKYATKLAEYNKKIHVRSENIEMGGLGTRSFSSDWSGGRVLRRKRRRRVEETTDLAAYMSNHNLFSYYEKRIHTADGTCPNEGKSNQGQFNGNDESEHNDEWLRLGSGDGDNSVEEMFRKIEILQSQTRNLKSRLDKVKGENPGKFSLVDDLDLPVSTKGLKSSARFLGSTPNNTDRMPVGSSDIASQLILQYNRDNKVKPESAVSSHGVVSHLPDKIKKTNPSFLVGTCQNTEDDVLIYNERMNAEMDDAAIKHVEKPQAEASADKTVPTSPVEQDLPADNQPPPKIRSISKLTAPKKRKRRGKRKGSW